MGSLRNPIGPLPSSIYWRRRAVALCIVVVLILLVLWAVNVLGGGGGDGDDTDNQGKGQPTGGPASSITPGPTDDPSATISERPGGRDEPTDDPGGGADGGSGGSGDGDEGQAGSDGGGTGGGSPGGAQLPPDSPLPTCTGDAVTVTLRTDEDSYAPSERPRINLAVRNTSGTDCKVDFGPKAAVITVTDVDGDTVWSSAHCPTNPAAALTRVPAGGQAPHALTWNRKPSAARCATPQAGAVPAGTYVVKAELGGGLTDQTSFVLTAS